MTVKSFQFSVFNYKRHLLNENLVRARSPRPYPTERIFAEIRSDNYSPFFGIMLYSLWLRKLPKEGSCSQRISARKELTPCSYGNVEMGGNTQPTHFSFFGPSQSFLRRNFRANLIERKTKSLTRTPSLGASLTSNFTAFSIAKK